jgi:uncharacterized protein (DUF1501 family)
MSHPSATAPTAGHRRFDSLSRRGLLQVGALGGVGLSLPQLLAADTQTHAARADSCIVIFLNGGPSHLDMWDMKPTALRRSAARLLRFPHH